MARDDFSPKTILALRERVGGRCSNPECRRPTTGPAVEPDRVVRVGIAAHIAAAAPGGPRYDAEQSAAERSAATNGIWLCSNCAALVDRDVQRYTAATLRAWKEHAESEALRRIEAQVAGPAASTPRWFGRQPGSSHRFVGRSEDLRRLHELIHRPEPRAGVGRSRVSQILGMGGVGKSFLAQRYAEVFAEWWPGGIFWLDSSRSEGLRVPCDATPRFSPFERIALDLGLDVRDCDADQVVAMVRTAVAKRDRSLWIVDDLPSGLSKVEVESWLVPAPAHVLFTTRSGEYGSLATTLNLKVLNADDAFELLTARATPSDASEAAAARELCTELGCHPLALAVAAASVGVWGGFARFLGSMNESGSPDVLEEASEDLREQLPTGCEANIIATLRRSIRSLCREGVDFLLLGSWMPALEIPAELVERAFRGLGSDNERESARARRKAWSQTGALSLCESVDADWRAVHPLICRAVRTLDRDERAIELRTATVRALHASLVDSPAEPIRDDVSIARVLVSAPRDELEADVLAAVADHDHARGLYSSAMSLRRRVIDAYSRAGSPNSHKALEVMNDLSLSLCEDGQFEEAERFAAQAFEGLSDQLGRDDLLAVSAMLNYSGVLVLQGRLAEASALTAEMPNLGDLLAGAAVTGDRKALKVLDDILTGLARTRPKDALAPLERVCGMMINTFGADDPDSLMAVTHLAEVLEACGQLPLARSAMEDVVQRRIRVQGDEHPETLRAINDLAEVLRAMGQLDAAHANHVHALAGMRDKLGPEHFMTLRCLNNLGCTLYQQLKHEKAKDALLECYEIRVRVLGEEHPETLASQHNLGLVHTAQGEAAEGAALLSCALSMRSRVLGEEDPDTLVSMVMLATARQLLGDSARAIELLTHASTRARNTLGDEHPVTHFASDSLERFLKAR